MQTMRIIEMMAHCDEPTCALLLLDQPLASSEVHHGFRCCDRRFQLVAELLADDYGSGMMA